MVERAENQPTPEELERSRVYFSELEDALIHYSSPGLRGVLHTVTTRYDEEGKPRMEIVSETRFPALDDLPDHLKRLRFVAERLDGLPAEFWTSHNYYLGRQISEDFPYIPMQVFLWGTENRPERREELKRFFQEEFGWEIKGAFTRDAHGYELSLKDFSWSNSDNPGGFRDDAEQCFRMVDAYIQLKRYFEEKGLPLEVEEF